MTKRVLVGVDGSDCSVKALRYAANLLGEDTEITALTSWRYPTSAYGVVGVNDWDPKADAEQVARDAVQKAFDGAAPVPVHAEVVEGPAAPSLIEHSAEFDLVVVGSRGHGGFAGMLLGSVSGAVAAHAKAPVLVFHAQD